ncbi:hypothetical protein B566_EDAN009088 [Ephemera danica]|nr:hypothetical protein B566_EDAN009088 [Ephemera danica]
MMRFVAGFLFCVAVASATEFRNSFPSNNLYPVAMVTIFGITTEFPALDRDACAYLIDGAICPLAAGAQSTYQLKIFIDPLWPAAPSMTIEFSLLDDFGNGETVVCTELDGTFRP